MSEKVNNPYFEHVFNVVRKNHTKQTFDEFYNNIHRSPRFNDEVKKQYINIVGKDNFDANQYAAAFNERIIDVPANATAYEKMAEEARNKAKEATQQAKATTAPTQPTDAIPTQPTDTIPTQPTDTIPAQPTDTIPTSEGKSPVDVSKLATASMPVSTKGKEEDSGNWWGNTGRKFMSSLANIGTSMVDNILRFGAAQAKSDVGFWDTDNMDMTNRIMDTMIDDVNQDKLGYQQSNTALKEKVEEADKAYYGVNDEGNSKGFMDLIKDGKVVKALQKGVSEGIGSMPTSLVAMIPFVGTSVVAVSSMNDKYKDLKQNNPEMGEVAIATNAVITGAIEGLSEKIGKAPILKELAIFKDPKTRDAFGDLFSELGTRAFARTFGRFLKSQGKEALGEGLEEVVSASGEMLVDFTTGKERDYSINDIAESFIYGAFGGAIGGKAMELGGKAVMYRGLSQERKERVRATYKNNTEFRAKVEDYISQYNDFTIENQQVFGDARKAANFNALCEKYLSGFTDYDTFKRDAIAMGIKPSSELNDDIAMGSVFENLDLRQEGSNAGIHSWFASVQEGNKAKTKEGKTTKKLTELSSLIHQYYANQDMTQVGDANSDIALFMSRNKMTQEQFADMLINGSKKDQAIFFDFIDKQIKNRKAERGVIQGVMKRNGIKKDSLLSIVERGLRGEELGENEAKIFADYKEASANFAREYQKGFFLDNYAQYANEVIKGLVNPETGKVETALYNGKRVNVVSGKVGVVVNSNREVKMTTDNPQGTVGVETIYNTKAEAKATGKKYKKIPGGKYAVYETVNVDDLTFVDSNTQAKAVANAVVSLDEAMTAQGRFKVDDVVVDAENNIGVVSEIDDRGNVSIESEDGTRLRLKGRDAKDKIQSVKFEPGQTFGEFTITKVNEDGSIVATDAKGESAIFGSKMELATFLADTGTGLYTPTTNDMEQIQDATGQNEQQIDESINAPQQTQENTPNEVVEGMSQEGEQGDNFYVDENGNKVYPNDGGQGDNFYVDENGNKVYYDAPTEAAPTDSNAENTPTENTPTENTPTEPTPTEPTREEVEEANATESQSKRTKETLQEDKAKAKETERKTNENIQRQKDSDAEIYNAKRRKEKERMVAIAFNTLRVSLPKVSNDIEVLYAEDVKEGHPCYEPLRMYGSSFKGMYSYKDGKVYIIADNCVSSTDMIETIMHEYVIHQGLRETMSEADYSELCSQIFDSMSEANKSLMAQYCGIKLPVKTDAEGNAMTLPINGLPIYDYSGISQSDINAIADEYMAHYAEDSSVLAVENGVVSKIIDAVRNKVFKGKSFRSAEELVKQMYNQRHYRLKSVQRDIANEQNNGTITNDRDSRYSVEAIVQGCGFDIREDDGDGNMALVCNVGGKEKVFSSANHITPQDVKNNVGNSFSFMVAQAISNGTIPAEKMDVYYQKYCDMLNLFLDKGAAENGGYSTVSDEYRFWNKETVARWVSTNSDTQYLQSIDIARMCRKNEPVINTISELQVRNGYGILPTQILDIYRATKEGGFDVPCSVCYVFSRYIRNGIFADSIISGMEEFKNDVKDVSKMNDKEKEEYARFWIKKREEYHKRDEKIAKNLPSNTDDLYIILQQMDALTKKLTVSKTTDQERATLMQALNVLQNKYQEVLKIRHNRKLYTFIDKFIITTAKSKGINIDGQFYNLREDAYFVDKIDDYKRHALDLRLSPVTPSLYPAICRVRNSGGSSAGKSIQYASNNTLGEVISGLSVQKPEDSRKNPFTTEKFKSGNTGDAAKQITSATNNVKAQNLRGGVRIFSWSDHMRSLAPDEFMNMIQLNIIGGGVQSYSKQLDGVQLIASCGACVNGSLIAFKDGFEEVPADDVYEFEGKKYSRKHETNIVDNNGNAIIERSPVYEENGKYYALIFDENVGIKANSSIKDGVIQPGIFEMNKRLDKAGNIMVGMNEKHIKMCLQDPRILFVIPYHKSGMNNHIFKGFMQIVESDSDIKAEDYTNAQSDIKFSDLQPKSKPRCYQVWQSHNYESKYKCGIEGGVKSDNPKGLTKTQKQYKALRDKIILRENLTEEEMTIISNDEFLSQVYIQITASDATMSKDDKDAIYPYEYWDYNSTIETADVNGERYLEYCRRLGFAPKFSGVYAKKSKEGKNEGDVEVEVEEVDLTSNKGYFIDEPGYWKVLIDRRMYDTNGNYQSITPVDITNFDVNTLSSAWNQEQFGDSYELKDADVQSIADAVENQWQNERVYDTYTFNYGADPTEALNNWKKYNNEWESLLKKNPEIKTILDNHNIKTDKVSAEEVDNVRSSMDALLNNGNSKNKNVLEDKAIKPELQEARFRIGNKRREDKRKTIVNKLSLMDDATYDAQIDYINELSESYKPNGGSTKLESCCLHWLEKGTLRLPEDNYKVLDAMKVLDRFSNIDGTKYNNPLDIIEQYSDRIKADTKTNPDDIKEFTDKKVTHNGAVVSYEVEDSKEGQKKVRQIVDEHWGKDANPWCLIQAQNGELTEESWRLWNFYNAYPKRIYFVNGELKYFSANDTKAIVYWDRKDEPQDSISYKNENGDVVSYYDRDAKVLKSIVRKDGSESGYYEDGNLEYERDSEGNVKEYYENGNIRYEKYSNGNMKSWYKNGNPLYDINFKGDKKSWYENGSLKYEEDSNGNIKEYFENGRLKAEQDSKGNVKEYYENGNPKYEKDSKGNTKEWHESGQLISEEDSEGNKKKWYASGNPKYEKDSKGNEKRWYANGQLQSELDSKGNTKEWYEDGKLKSEKDSEGNEKRWYEDGRLEFVRDSKGNYKSWYDNGKLRVEGDSEGNTRWWYPNGQLESENDFEGNYKSWYENGLLAYEKDSEGNYKEWYKNGQLESEEDSKGKRKGWYENGNLKYEEDSEGNYKEYQENGLLAYEEDSEGNKKFYDKDGNLKPNDGTVRYRITNSDIKKEEDAIIAKAKANGTYMKTPNGNPTKLSPKQWVQVRTKAFKDWFGDWENDPENASQVVENGEPRVVYHQTNSTIFVNRKTGENFNNLSWKEKDYWKNEASEKEWNNTWEEKDFYVFDNKSYGRRSIEMPAFFFATEYDEYHEYGERTIAAFLNIRKPIVNPDIPNIGVTNTAGEDAMNYYIEQGYDGFIREDDGEVYEINAFFNNQIKSADDNIGTFDPTDADIRYRVVKDKKIIDSFNKAEKITTYRAMVLHNGKLYPVMNTGSKDMKYEGGVKEGDVIVTDTPDESVMRQVEKDYEDGKLTLNANGEYIVPNTQDKLIFNPSSSQRWYYLLVKDQGSPVPAAFNPYIHSSSSPLNDQFKSAWQRDNIVTVEMEITLDDIDGSGNSSYGAKDNVGSVDWNAGVLQNALTKTRQVYLSKYGKVKGIVPDSKVAEIISSQLNDTFKTLPSNVFTPSVRDELSKLGYTFETTNSSGIITEGVNKGKSWNDLYKPNRLTSKDGKDFGLYYPDGNILFNDNIDIFNTKASDVFPLFLNIFKNQFGDVYSEVKDKMMLNTKDNNIRQNIFENARKNDDKILNAIKNRDNAPVSIQEGVDLFNSTMANFFNVDEFNIDNSLAEIQNKERVVSSPVSSFDNNADMDAKLKKDGVRFRRNINGYKLVWNVPQGKQDGFEWMKDYAIWRKSMIDNGYYKETDLPLFPSKNLSKMSFEDYVETSKQIKEWITQAQFVDDYVQEMRRNERITRKFITGVADNCFALKNFYDFFRKQEGCIYDVETMNAYEDSFRRGRRAQNHILDFTNNYERALLENVSSILKSEKLKDIELYWKGFEAITNKSNINGKRLTEREVLELYMQCKDMIEARDTGLPNRGIEGFANNIRGSFDTIDDFVQAVEDRIGDVDVKLFWGNVNKCTKWSLELMNKYGVIDKDEYLELMKRNYYVPERGWKERDFEERELGYTGRNGGEYSPYNPALVRAKGRESLASSPLVYIRSIAHSTALYVEKERTKQCMLNFVKANEGLGLATGAFHFKRMYFVSVKDEYGNVLMQDGKPVIVMTETAPTKEMYDEDEKIKEQISSLQDRLVEAQEGYDAALKYKKANDLARYDSLITDLNNEIEELRKQRNVYKYVNDSDIIERTKSEKGQHSVIVHSEGFTYYLEFKDERIANILNGNLGRNESNIKEAIKKAGIERTTRFLASLKTQYSPVFALRNLARDGSFAHIMNLVKYGPRTASQQTMQMFYNMPLVASYVVNKGDLSKVDGKYKTYLEEFVEGGAQTGFSFTKPISQLNEDLNKDLDDIAKSNTANSELGWKDIAVKYINLISKEKAPKVFSAMSEISEMMVRFGQYVAMREKGLGVNEAITEAKEVTVNFDRRGQLGNMLGGLYYFMNATIQGTVNIFNAAWHNPKRAAKIGGVGLMAMVLGFLNTLMNPDDPEDDVLWGEYDRNANVVFKVGGLNVKLPLPHFFRIFWAAGVNVAQFQNNNKSATEAVTDAITFALDDIIPTSVLSVQSLIGYNEIEDAVVFNEWENYVHNVSPSLIQPAVDVVMNRDFLGNPIGRRPFTVNDEDRLAENLLYRRGANEYTIAACNWIRDITGGDSKNKYKDPGLRGIDINPSKVEYFIRSYFSGAPTDLVGVFDFMTKCIDTEYDVTPSDVPILKSFTKDYNQDKAYNMMYYTLEQRIDFLDKYYRESRKAGTKAYYEEGTTNYTDEYKRFLRAKRILRSKKRPTFDNNKPYKTEDIVDLMEAVHILNGSDY